MAIWSNLATRSIYALHAPAVASSLAGSESDKAFFFDKDGLPKTPYIHFAVCARGNTLLDSRVWVLFHP